MYPLTAAKELFSSKGLIRGFYTDNCFFYLKFVVLSDVFYVFPSYCNQVHQLNIKIYFHHGETKCPKKNLPLTSNS